MRKYEGECNSKQKSFAFALRAVIKFIFSIPARLEKKEYISRQAIDEKRNNSLEQWLEEAEQAESKLGFIHKLANCTKGSQRSRILD